MVLKSLGRPIDGRMRRGRETSFVDSLRSSLGRGCCWNRFEGIGELHAVLWECMSSLLFLQDIGCIGHDEICFAAVLGILANP